MEIRSILILLVAASILVGGCTDSQEKPQDKNIPGGEQNIQPDQYCRANSDCVADGCCHPSSCVNTNFKKDCADMICTLECKPGTLDCGQGSCLCQNNKCTAVFK